jgi:integrase
MRIGRSSVDMKVERSRSGCSKGIPFSHVETSISPVDHKGLRETRGSTLSCGVNSEADLGPGGRNPSAGARSGPWAFRIIENAAKAAGLGRLGTHSFRHTFRSWLDAVGTALTVQQKLMRHADIQTTLNIYGDVVTDEMRQAGSKLAERALKSDSRLIPVLANN